MNRFAVRVIWLVLLLCCTQSFAQYADCRAFYAVTDQTVTRTEVRDAQEAAVDGFPYLRVNRFLAAAIKNINNDEQFDFAAEQMLQADRRARQIELNNLPPAMLGELRQYQQKNFPDQANITAAFDYCGELMLRADRARLIVTKAKIHAPASYSILKRLAGLYPLTAIPFSRGIRKFQAEMTQSYAKPLSDITPQDALVFHAPPATTTIDVAALIRHASENPLHMPLPNEAELAQLFAQFAPNFAIDTRDEFDRPGAVAWGNDQKIRVDISAPHVYTLASHTVFEGKFLLQLNYFIWFSERPKRGNFDMLGGALDGVIWRVTLGADGTPLIYDSIHPCGCYHLFFPTEKLRAKAHHPSLQEHAYVPQGAPDLPSGTRPTIWIESATHYVLRVTNEAPSDSIQYQMADYDQLRSLPRSDGTRRSLFRPDGLVAGSERGERIFFWPMGIKSAGAMRQWGHHATAFVGIRHFDDADLIEKAFENAK